MKLWVKLLLGYDSQLQSWLPEGSENMVTHVGADTLLSEN